jgi:YD repeat-containing protein
VSYAIEGNLIYTYQYGQDSIIRTDALAAVTRYEQDSNGRVSKMVNCEGQTYQYDYSQQGMLLSTLSSDGTASTVFDDKGRKTEETDATGIRTFTTYNEFNHLTEFKMFFINLTDDISHRVVSPNVY